jgi:hypothetical protein
MYTPQAAWAHDSLKGRKDPPRSVEWWPAQSWVSCDARTAVKTGPWRFAASRTDGYFTSLWMRQPSGDWRWTVDGGDQLETPLARRFAWNRDRGNDRSTVAVRGALLAPVALLVRARL